MTIGALDPKSWRTLLGGTWRQRAGRIASSGPGSGFGGRTLCLSESPPPEGPFELAVDVHLEDESAAAGLVFHSDGGDKHYGFYPTGGALRLTRFEGPDVYRWKILNTVSSEHYRNGQWNTIHVRVDGTRFTCSVNGEVVIEAEDSALGPGKVGLVKFRDPSAEFRRFRVDRDVPDGKVSDDETQRILTSAARDDAEAIADLARASAAAVHVLHDRANDLEKQADRLRRLADQVHRRATERELVALLKAKEEDVDLLRSALLLAKLDNDDLDVEPYVEMVDRMAHEVEEQAGDVGDAEKLDVLIQYLFRESGFHGGSSDYYHRSNSYVNEVLDDREGLPITLSVVFMEIARRIGLPVVGVSAPGHFLVEFKPAGGEGQLIDVFDGGKFVTPADAAVLSGQAVTDEQLAPATKRQIILRMLANLLGVAERERDSAAMLGYLDVILALDDDASMERWVRAVLRFQNDRSDEAADDLDRLLRQMPAELNLDRVQELREVIRRQIGR
jgi:regulator of sirC expression with transglutaminase-like and TPR domain